MVEKISRRRNISARELAEQFGVSRRTVQRLIAEDREDYLARVQNNRERARQMKAEGASIKEIQEALDVSRATVYRYLADAK